MDEKLTIREIQSRYNERAPLAGQALYRLAKPALELCEHLYFMLGLDRAMFEAQEEARQAALKEKAAKAPAKIEAVPDPEAEG